GFFYFSGIQEIYKELKKLYDEGKLKEEHLKILVGLDIDKNALKSAKRNLSGRKVQLLHGDVLKKLPFQDSSFDKIIMSEVCEHLEDDVKGLKEAKRLLKKGGIIVVTVPNKNYPFFWDPVNWILQHFFGTHIKEGFWAGIWNQHLRLYTPEELAKVIEKSGLKILKLQSLTYWCLPFNHNLMHLAARGLHSGKLDKSLSKAINKFENNPKRPFYINLAFKIVNLVDKLNDLYQPSGSGVGVLAVVTK
ncbi:MAG: methyltransferase domain-containing protein, partial [Patescibacteria group bacterium]|nr:methyltransferase domain-containing protein [Patescibacteria group bacterium]